MLYFWEFWKEINTKVNLEGSINVKPNTEKIKQPNRVWKAIKIENSWKLETMKDTNNSAVDISGM